MPGVDGVSARRTDDVALFRSRRADLTLVDDLPDGYKISLGAGVDDVELGVDLGLAPGEVALTVAGAEFRDLDVGGTVRLGDGADFVGTVAVVTDEPSLQDLEIIVAADDADAMGIRDRTRATLRLSGDADPETVVAAARGVVGEDAIVLPREARDRPVVLDIPTTKRLFGEFAFEDLPGRDIRQGVSFTREHITQRDVPFFGIITCHEDVFDPLIAALQQVRDEGLGDEIVPELYAGCWTPRRINRNANLSRHSWGIAIDINVDFDEPGGGPIPSEGVIAAFEANGFAWGGDYPTPDNHHFEYVGPADGG